MDVLQVPKIGEILIKERLTDEPEIQKALDEQRSSGRMLGEILLDNNTISREQLKKALHIQFRHKLAIAVLSIFTTAFMPSTLKASESTSVLITGRVAPTSSVSISRELSSMADTSLSGNIPELTARITEQNNNQTGYSIILEAKSIDESGQLALVSKNENSPLPYKITYGNKDIYFTDGKALISNIEASKDNKKTETKELKISPEIMGNLDEYFSDTLTLIIKAK